MVSAVLGKFGFIGLFVAEFGIAAKSHMFHQVRNFVNLGRFDEFVARTENNPNIKNGTIRRINQEAPGAVLEPDLLNRMFQLSTTFFLVLASLFLGLASSIALGVAISVLCARFLASTYI